MADGIAEGDVLSALVHKDLCQRGSHKIQGTNRRSGEECEEVSIIASSDAVVDPDTMMIGRLDAVVAEAAVVSPGRSPDVAGLAVLCRHFHSSS